MLAQLAEWDPEFGMVEIENLELIDTSNPVGEAAEQNFLTSVDSMSILQKGTEGMTIPGTLMQPPVDTTPARKGVQRC
jgi:hypothetical protein